MRSVGVAVFPLADSGMAEGDEEAGVDVSGLVNPVIICAGEVVWGVEPGVHYQGGGCGENGWVGEKGD